MRGSHCRNLRPFDRVGDVEAVEVAGVDLGRALRVLADELRRLGDADRELLDQIVVLADPVLVRDHADDVGHEALPRRG